MLKWKEDLRVIFGEKEFTSCPFKMIIKGTLLWNNMQILGVDKGVDKFQDIVYQNVVKLLFMKIKYIVYLKWLQQIEAS